MIGQQLLTQILTKWAGDAGRSTVEARMSSAVPAIANRMAATGMTMQNTPVEVLIRDALFRLWRAVIPSGDIADLLRDGQEDAIKPKVQNAFPHPLTPSPPLPGFLGRQEVGEGTRATSGTRKEKGFWPIWMQRNVTHRGPAAARPAWKGQNPCSRGVCAIGCSSSFPRRAPVPGTPPRCCCAP
jgi:hypothetical protein